MRDVRVSSATVLALMVAVGVATSGAFASEAAAVPQNFVLFFSVKDPYVASALLAVCLAIFGAYLSILYVCRITVSGLLRSDGQAHPGMAQVAACNVATLGATTCAAASQFQGGTILSIGSAGCALIQVSCFPALMRLKFQLSFDELVGVVSTLQQEAAAGTLETGDGTDATSVPVPSDVCGMPPGNGTTRADGCGVANGDNST